jgi:O-antigen/teichoic acid export membrane protein
MTLSLLFSSVLAPLARLFQILDRISYTYLLYLFSFVVTSLLQFVLVFWLRLDVYGIAWATVGNSAGLTLFVVAMLRHCGVHLNWRVVFRNAALAFILASIGVAISGWLESKSGDLAGEMIAGVSYWAVIAAGYYLARARLLEIIR